MLTIVKRLRALTSKREPILLTGEPGTGKTLAARLCHAFSRRKGCAVFDAREPGAQDVAISEAAGATSNETVIIRHADALPVHLWERLVAHQRHARPEGAPMVLATSTADRAANPPWGSLVQRVFRARVSLPPLRERSADIVHLVEHFLLRHEAIEMTQGAYALLLKHEYRDNVRELEAIIAKAAERARGGLLVEADVLRSGVADSGAPQVRITWGDDVLNELERKAIALALDTTDGNRTRAAQLLSVSRPTLIRLIAKHRIPSTSPVGRPSNRGRTS